MRSPRVSSAEAPPQAEDRRLTGANRSNHRRRQSVAEEAAAHGQADLRADPGDGPWRKVHPGEGAGEEAFAGEAGGVHAVGSSVGRGAGGFCVCAGEGFNPEEFSQGMLPHWPNNPVAPCAKIVIAQNMAQEGKKKRQ